MAVIFATDGNRKATSVPSSAQSVKWMDFNATTSALCDAMSIDIKTNDDEYPISWIDIIAYLASIYGNDFSKYSPKDIDTFVQKIQDGFAAEEICEKYKYYDYYKTTYGAALSGFVGDYELGLVRSDATVEKVSKYGLKAFSPIAAGFSYNHYDDYGAPRSYGFRRSHLGNDLMGSIGTPIVAVESGKIEAIGWNRYGGWRIGIRSFDGKRYYYYAHLRKDHPYAADLKLGDTVGAGSVIGYLGMTGYSEKENVNNINTPHLHFGMQIIFDESQKDGNGEIWIDVFSIVKLLSSNRSEVIYDRAVGKHVRRHGFKDLSKGVSSQ